MSALKLDHSLSFKVYAIDNDENIFLDIVDIGWMDTEQDILNKVSNHLSSTSNLSIYMEPDYIAISYRGDVIMELSI